MLSVSLPREQGMYCFRSPKMNTSFSTFIVSPPVYLHTAFLDDFFLRPFPYTLKTIGTILR